MTTLTDIRAARATAQTNFDAAWSEAMQALRGIERVRAVAGADGAASFEVLRAIGILPAGVELAAKLAGYRRELEALAKVEADLVANGKPSPISDLPSSIS